MHKSSDYAYWDKKYPPLFESVIMPASAQQLLLAGVTSARDLGGPLKASLAVRDAINAGKIPGPTLYISGPFIQHEPYPGTELFRWGINGVVDARAKVLQLAQAGVNCIKLIDQDQMTMDEVNAVVDEAHKNKLTVVAHAHRPEEIRRGLAAGVDCFEHTGLATAPEYPADIFEMIRSRTAQMNKDPLFWCPTIEGLMNYEYTRDNGSHPRRNVLAVRPHESRSRSWNDQRRQIRRHHRRARGGAAVHQFAAGCGFGDEAGGEVQINQQGKRAGER